MSKVSRWMLKNLSGYNNVFIHPKVGKLFVIVLKNEVKYKNDV